MKRLRRRLFNSLTLLSLLIFLSTPILWWRSHSREDAFYWFTPRMTFGVDFLSSQGSVQFGWTITNGANMMAGPGFSSWGGPQTWDLLSELRRNYRHCFIIMGFGLGHGTTSYSDLHQWINSTDVVLPDGFLLLMGGILPAIWLARFLKRRRSQIPGHCPNCGYDLRATPDRCPECGSVAPVAKAQ